MNQNKLNWHSIFHVLALYRHSIRYRLMIYFLILVLLPVSILTSIIYSRSAQTISENITTSIQNNLSLVEGNIVQKIEDMNTIASFIYLNPKLQNILSSGRPADDTAIINELSNLGNIMQDYDVPDEASPQIRPKLFILDRPEYYQKNFTDNIANMESIENTAWFQSIPFRSDFTVIGMYADEKPFSKVTALRYVKRLYALRHIQIPMAGLLTIDLNLDDINQILTSLKPSPNSTIYLLDASNRIITGPANEDRQTQSIWRYISSNAPEWKDRMSLRTVIGGTEHLVSYRTIELTGWKAISISPMQDLNGKLVAFRKVIIIMLVLCVLVATILSFLMTNDISSPIRKFVHSMSYTKTGTLSEPIVYTRRDEFSFMFDHYNRMIRQLNELIQKLYVTEARKKKAELDALQAQINPHFLYNTLDSINWLAIDHQAPDISKMVTALSDFFRLSLNKGKNIITVQEELRQAESYLIIQQIRSNNRISYYINVEEELLRCLTVKLLLQPLIENAILHGIEKRRGTGVIQITIHSLEPDKLTIEILDNGVGAEVDKLNEQLRSKPEEGAAVQSFGTRNVNDRIQMWFGEGYGLSYREHQGQGVLAVIELPIVHYMEEIADVKNDHSG
ncbi:sensor histidine kinase [Paenibacillus sp. GCM10023252]|uniref:sensor histidine kinase n=1 Tax=Paenibacillus sp. GCM10023252 TaxID=3252649 RepID=UPI0036205B39